MPDWRVDCSKQFLIIEDLETCMQNSCNANVSDYCTINGNVCQKEVVPALNKIFREFSGDC
jgi:hypothetical protein